MSKTQGIPVVTPGEAKARIELIMSSYDPDSGEHPTPVFLHGPPGVGKSSIVHQIAAERKMTLLDLRLVTTDAVDMRGMPYKSILVDGTAIMDFASSGLLPRVETDGERGILFLDEFPQATTLVQNAASELLLDRRIGSQYTLPDGWYIVAAGNRRMDRAGTQEIPNHLRNRVCHLEVYAHAQSWVTYAKQRQLHDGLIKFIEQDGKQLFQFTGDQLAFATPRSMEFVSRVLKHADRQAAAGEKVDKKVLWDVVAGLVGDAAMSQMRAVIEANQGIPTYAEIVSAPASADVPTHSGQLFALVESIATQSVKKDIVKLSVYLDRLPAESARIAVSKVRMKHPTATEVKEFKALYDRVLNS